MQNRAWQDKFYDAIRPYSTGGAYQNFIDPSLADWRSAYYRENLDRLERIKKQVDPGAAVRFPAGICGARHRERSEAISLRLRMNAGRRLLRFARNDRGALHHQHLHQADRLFAPVLRDRGAHAAPDRLGDRIRIAPARLRQRRRSRPRRRRRCRPSARRRRRSGMPISSISGSASSAPLSSIASATPSCRRS